MQLAIKNFLYFQVKEICERRHSSQLIRKHLLEILSCLITLFRFIFGLITYLLHNNKSSSFRYFLYDPLPYYFYINFPHAFIQYITLGIMSILFALIGEYVFFFQPVNTLTYRIFYDLIVNNLDQVKQCSLDKSKRRKLIEQFYSTNVEKWSHSFPLLWNIPAMKFILKKLCWKWTKLQLSASSEVIDKKKMNVYKLQSAPNISLHCRSVLAKFVQLTDLCFYYFHLLTSTAKSS